MPDFIDRFSLHMRKRKVELRPGSRNQTYHYDSYSLGGSMAVDDLNNLSRYFPRVKLYLNASYSSYTGGIGTRLITNGKPEDEKDLIISLGGSMGWGHNRPLRVDMLNQYTPSAITNNNDFAIMYQSNIIFKKTGLSQVSASIGLRWYSFTLSAYNDVDYFGATDGNDRFWSGGAQLGYHPRGGGSVVLGTDIYTGQRIRNPSGGYKTFENNGQLFYQESESDISLNQGSVYIKTTLKSGKFLMIDYSGRNAMFPQQWLHEHVVDKPFFASEMPNTLMLSFGQDM
jgi:hypothetical protein